ncbi:MAG: tRNA pseudouridine synthase B, partial [Anaerolineales bacterium]
REVEALLPEFTGTFEQVPPPYSAIKVSGRKAYEMARRGEEVELGPRRVTIERLEIVSYEPPDLTVQIECSAGTYIRSLAHDLGERLGCGAHLWALRRTRAGPFSLDQAVPLARLEAGFGDGSWEACLRPATDALRGMAKIPIALEALERVRNGHPITASGVAEGLAAGIGPDGELVAILEGRSGGQVWHPRKVFLS